MPKRPNNSALRMPSEVRPSVGSLEATSGACKKALRRVKPHLKDLEDILLQLLHRTFQAGQWHANTA